MQVDVSRFASLDEAKAYARRAIDEAAERARTKYVTPGSGQAMEYQACREEAIRYLGGESGSWPMLQADVSGGTLHPVTGQPVQNLEEAAEAVMIMYGAWQQVGAAIRTIRLGAKAQVTQASSQAQVAQIREQAIASLDSL